MNNIYLDFSVPLSYNSFLTFIITERGLGKSYGAKKYVTKHFLSKGKEFVYLRRYKTELKESLLKNQHPIFFDQIKNDPDFKDKNIKFHNTKDTFYINDKIAGYAIPLSISNILKSSTYENVDTIIFDEFIIDKGTYHYLQNEVIQLLDLIETIGRLRNIRFIFLGNAISITNPYFTYFNLTLPYNSDVNIAKRDKNGNPLIIVYYAKNTPYREVKKETRFGQLIEGTSYGKYAIDNEFLRDSKAFISKRSKNSKHYFILIINGKKYGVWRDYTLNNMYISNIFDPNCPIKFTINPDDHNETTLLLRCRTSPFTGSIIEHYRFGKLFFDNVQIKNNVLDFLHRFLTY